jgi:chromosome partitioning protein
MNKVIAVALQKGGVGKTTTAHHLSSALAMMGRKVLAVDLDPQASLTRRFDQTAIDKTMTDVLGGKGEPTATLSEIIVPTHQPRLDLAPADERLAQSNDRLWMEQKGPYALDLILKREGFRYHYIIIDTAPGMSVLLRNALVAADEVIIPVQLSPMGFEGFDAIDQSIVAAREAQEIRGEVRLTYRAILPTFFAENELITRAYMRELLSSEHPDFEDMLLPLAPMPVVETTAFKKASSPILMEGEGGGVRRARAIWEMPEAHYEGSPADRGQEAYMKLARYVDGFQ